MMVRRAIIENHKKQRTSFVSNLFDSQKGGKKIGQDNSVIIKRPLHKLSFYIFFCITDIQCDNILHTDFR